MWDISLCLLIILFSYIIIRSELVFKERDRVASKILTLGLKDIDSVYKKNIANINLGGDAYLPYENLLYDRLMLEYYKITYLEMIFKFWIPVKRFYRNLC